MVPIKPWIEYLRKQIFDRVYCVESNIVRIKVVILYCFFETVADSLGSLAIYATRYSYCVVIPPSTPLRMISRLSGHKLEVGSVILSDVRNICKRTN